MSNLIGTRVNPNWFTKWITMEGPFHAKIGVAGVKTEYQEEFKQCIQAQQVQQYKQSMAAGKKITQTPVDLTQEQLAYLKENYDPQNMTQAEYNAFVADLEAFGVLSEGDASCLDAGEDAQFTPLESGCGICAWDGQGMSLQDYLDDALAWCRFRASFRTVDPETGKFYTGKQAALFGRVQSVMERLNCA